MKTDTAKTVAAFFAGRDPAGIAALFEKKGIQFILMAPSNATLQTLSKSLGLGTLNTSKCKPAKLKRDKSALFDPV